MRKSDAMPTGAYSSTLHISKLPGLDYSKIIDIKSRYKRSRISIKEGKSAIEFVINAEDPVALRASLNAVMRSMEVIENAYKAKLPARSKSGLKVREEAQ
ncbi:MAG: KEOPS complex subunit Pcc1 [Candidatus Micrarchaeia archaeon]